MIHILISVHSFHYSIIEMSSLLLTYNKITYILYYAINKNHLSITKPKRNYQYNNVIMYRRDEFNYLKYAVFIIYIEELE